MTAPAMGPACAIGSRAELPACVVAAGVILANDCADYLECVGWHTGAARRDYLRSVARDYCGFAEECGGPLMRGALSDAETVAQVESYMRRHVAAYVRKLRAIRAAWRKRARVMRHREAFAAMSDSDLADTLRVLTDHGLARDSVSAAIAAGILRAETRLRVRHGYDRRNASNKESA